MGPYAFGGTPLKSVDLPKDLTYIDEGVFSATSLSSIKFTNSLQGIGKHAFFRTKLVTVTIPDNIKEVGEKAFSEIKTLVMVSMPDKIVLQPEVFQASYALSQIEYCGKLVGFPVTPICPPERKAAIDKEASDSLAAEIKAKQEAEAKAAADKVVASKAATAKKITITCVKGKLTKKVIAVKPKCPNGYKLKK